MFDSWRGWAYAWSMAKNRPSDLFEQLGFSDHRGRVYGYLFLQNGAASIRQIAGDTGINRGTVYESLKEVSAIVDLQVIRRKNRNSNSSPKTRRF